MTSSLPNAESMSNSPRFEKMMTRLRNMKRFESDAHFMKRIYIDEMRYVIVDTRTNAVLAQDYYKVGGL